MIARQLTGVVLAGGRSTRMGRDKARLVVDGLPLWRRQTLVLKAAGAATVLVALRTRQRSLGRPRHEIRDTRSDAGPMAGIHAALQAARTDWIATLAVDLPQLPPTWFRLLARRCGERSGAMARTAAGFEPLAAIYPRAALPVFSRHLARGQFSLQQLAAELVRRRLLVPIEVPARQLR